MPRLGTSAPSRSLIVPSQSQHSPSTATPPASSRPEGVGVVQVACRRAPGPELFGQAGLCQKDGSTGVQRTLIGGHVPRQEDDRNPARAMVLLQAPRGADPVESRHLEIHDDDVRPQRDGERNSLLAITRDGRAEAPELKELDIKVADVLHVFSDQDNIVPRAELLSAVWQRR